MVQEKEKKKNETAGDSLQSLESYVQCNENNRIGIIRKGQLL